MKDKAILTQTGGDEGETMTKCHVESQIELSNRKKKKTDVGGKIGKI